MIFFGGGSRALLYIEIFGPKLLYNSLCQTETVYYELKNLLVFEQNNFGHLHSNFRVLLIKHFSAPPPPHAYIAADNFSYEAVFVAAEGAHVPIQGLKDMRMCFSNNSACFNLHFLYNVFLLKKLLSVYCRVEGVGIVVAIFHTAVLFRHDVQTITIQINTLINGLCIQLISKKGISKCLIV